MLTRLGLALTRWSTAFARRFRNNFYLFLAGLMTLGILLDAGVFHVGENMRQKAFDFMVRHRIATPKPDPEIVIIDINEASLAALAGDYGRWPWPRQVFGEFLEQIEKQQPRAVVFDILFSDPDVFNPDSDAYFNDSIAATDNTYFPFLRLSEVQDGLSRVEAGMIPGARLIPGQENHGGTVAVVLPHFEAALKPGKLGYHNIYPDADGIVREYRVWREDYGWKLPSLPLTIATALGTPTPESQSVLLNWRGGPFTYHYVSFSDVYRDITSKVKRRPQDEFAGKILIIGSTAPSLFDLKATAMDKFHPGVEILATAIDNIRHDDYLHIWRGALPYVLLSLLLLWLTALAFYRNVDRDRFNRAFSTSQLGLLAVSYAGINLTNTYLDLTGPVTWAIAYFSIAKIYALATDRALQQWLAYGVSPGETGMGVTLMPVLIESAEPLGDALLKKMKRGIDTSGSLPKDVAIVRGTQSGLWGLLGNMLLVSWSYSADSHEKIAAVVQEAGMLGNELPQLARRIGLPASVGVRFVTHQGTLDGKRPLAPQWRVLLAQALIKLEQPTIGG